MAYVGETPWHGLGQVLQPGASIENWQQAAGMNWSIRRGDMQYFADRACTDLRLVPDQKVLFRGDTGAKLGIVSNEYQIVQPSEVLEFFRDLVATQGFQLETAGTMFGGSRYWALAKVTKAVISGWDEIGGYCLISTTADGSRATEIRKTTVRVVCNNTLSMALSLDSKEVIRITHRQRFDSERVQQQMGLSLEEFDSFIEVAHALSKIRVTKAAADDFVTRLLRKAGRTVQAVQDDEDEDQLDSDTKQRKPRGLEIITSLFEGQGHGATKQGSAGTAWGLVNAVTEYVDHLSSAKTVSHRLDRAFFGSGDVLKTLALQRALVELV